MSRHIPEINGVVATPAMRKAIIAAEMRRRGRKGGATITPARRAASRANLAKARASRWPKKKVPT